MTDAPDFTPFTSLLDEDGPIALIIKQELAPDDEDEKVIFPPTYPMTQFKGRVHRFEHGEYRVSIELPPDTKRDKDDRKENQKPGYQIDRFPDGRNVCEIDSIQSQSNRIEPQFKTINGGKLVPQVSIVVGSQSVNLLDAGHRAADAVVRMSSLAPEFYDAWTDAKAGGLHRLAGLAPTAIIFGAWDSRSSQAKLQRLIKAHIRATNVVERTRSAQYTPAADYVALGAVPADVNQGEDEKNYLSQEGMKHALSTQTVGGVALTASSSLIRTVNVNLAAIRHLRAGGIHASVRADTNSDAQQQAIERERRSEEERTLTLRNYILGLTLVAASQHPNLNLREGCNLQMKGEGKITLVGDRRKNAPTLDLTAAATFAEHAARAFFGDAYDTKDRQGVFESGVAEEFLSMSAADRDKVRVLGPLTRKTLRQFAEQNKDPLKSITEAIKSVKAAIGKAPGKKSPRIKNLPAFVGLVESLIAMSGNTSLDQHVRELADQLLPIAKEHDDSHVAIREIESKIRDFKKSRTAERATDESAVTEVSEEASQ